MAYERVYAITDYWDGPRAGAADYRDSPHGFRSVWSAKNNDWDLERYFLYPLTIQHAQWEAESWAIWRRFTKHYQGKKAPAPEIPSDWGALPEDLSRHRELQGELARIRAIERAACFTATGSFRRIDASPSGFVAPMLEVEWKESPPKPDDQLLPLPAI